MFVYVCTDSYVTEHAMQYSTVRMHVCHSCVSPSHREGSVAPVFVPNRKQTQKYQRWRGRGEEERTRWVEEEEEEDEERAGGVEEVDIEGATGNISDSVRRRCELTR